MAKKLAQQKRSAYRCPPKACPAPADLIRFPEIMSLVRADWRRRTEDSRKRGARDFVKKKRKKGK